MNKSKTNWLTLPVYTGRISSHVFICLALSFYILNYPRRVIYGQLLQYVFSILVWLPPVYTHVLWCDRCLAVGNMVMLCVAHNARGVPYLFLISLLALTIVFKLIDWKVAIGNEVTIWYIFWHLALLGGNLMIGIWSN